MASRKLVLGLLLGSGLAAGAVFTLCSEVRADAPDVDELPVAAALDEDSLERAQAFAGEYEFAGGQKQRDGVDAAIAKAMDAISPLFRKIGTKRLKANNPVSKQVSIAINGDKARVAFGMYDNEAPLDGTRVKTKSKAGDRIKLRHRVRGSTLVQTITGDGGKRTNSFTLSEDGQRLTVRVKITSDQLPVPVEYRLSYKRK